MTDEQLAEFLNIPLGLVPKLTLSMRARYEALAPKVFEVQLYDAGIGPKPEGVIICEDHRRKP